MKKTQSHAIKKRRERPLPKKPTVTLIKKPIVRKGLPIIVATALTLGSAHFAMKHQFGKSYPKKIPIVRNFAVHGRQMTFVFGKHTHANDLLVLEKQLQEAQKEGKPFNTFIFEGADIPNYDRRNAEAQMNKLVRQYRKIYDFFKDPNKAVRDAAKVELKKLQNISARNLGSFDAKKIELCAKYDLHVKYGEQYSPREIQVMLQSWVTADKASQLKQYEDEIKVRAMHLKLRNQGISKTLPLVLEEARTKVNGPVRAVFYVGATHVGVSKYFDRNQFVRTHIVNKGIEFGEDVSPSKAKKVELIANEVIKLTELSDKEIMQWKINPKILEELKKLDKGR